MIDSDYKAKIIHRDSFSPHPAVEAIQAGPRLIAGGSKIKELKQTSSHSQRAGLCVDSKQRVIFFVTSGFGGTTLSTLQSALLSESIGCFDSLNLDGGSSAQMYIAPKLPGASQEHQEMVLGGTEAVPVAIGLFQKDPKFLN